MLKSSLACRTERRKGSDQRFSSSSDAAGGAAVGCTGGTSGAKTASAAGGDVCPTSSVPFAVAATGVLSPVLSMPATVGGTPFLLSLWRMLSTTPLAADEGPSYASGFTPFAAGASSKTGAGACRGANGNYNNQRCHCRSDLGCVLPSKPFQCFHRFVLCAKWKFQHLRTTLRAAYQC
jgi:hypothetical protein